MKKLFYITLISTSLITVVFFNGKIIVLDKTSGSDNALVLKENKETNLDNSKTGLFKSSIEKYTDFMGSIPRTLILFILIIFLKLYLEELFANTITIRGPPITASKHSSNIIVKKSPFRSFFKSKNNSIKILKGEEEFLFTGCGWKRID